MLVTNQRLLSRAPDATWRAWPYRPGLTLKHHDHAGVGHLELMDAQGLLATWRFTLGRNLQAFRLWRFAKPYQWQLLAGLPADAGFYCRHAGAALPDHAADGQRADSLSERRSRSTTAWSRCCFAACSGAALLAWVLGWAQDLHPGAGVRAHRRRPAHHHLRTPAAAVAGIFRRQAHRRPDVAHRHPRPTASACSCRCTCSISPPTC